MEYQEKLPIFWSQDRHTIRKLIAEDFACQHSQSQALDVKPIIVRTHCLNRNCSCVLRSEGALIMKCIRQSALVQAIWQKASNKSTQLSQVAQQLHLTSADKPAHLILSSFNNAWFEVLNEDGNSIPYWTVAKELVSSQPLNFLVRKDMKVIFAKPINGNSSFEIHTDNVGIVKSGTVLNYIEYNQFRVVKSRKMKEFMLIKCCNSIGQLLFIYPDEKCALSPVASADNISGVHTISSVLQKFQLPVSMRPVLGSLGSWLPSSDRHFLRLNSSYFGDLIFLEPLSAITGRFFVVTADMLDDHLFSIGESESPYHFHLLDQNTRKIRQFLASCHPYESLRYLLNHLPNITNKLMTVCNCESDVTTVDEEEVNQLMDEIEDIYFYVRTGKYPLPSRSRSVGTSLGQLNLNRKSTMCTPHTSNGTTPYIIQTEGDGHIRASALSRSYSPPRAVLMPSPSYQHNAVGPISSEKHNSPPLATQHINRFCSCQQLNHKEFNLVPVDIQDSTITQDSIRGSTSCDNLLQQNHDRIQPPPLPPRQYNCVTPQSALYPQHPQYFHHHSKTRASTTIRRDGYAVVRKTQPLTFVH